MLPEAAAEHYRSQQRLTVAALGLVRAEWSKMRDDLDASWSRVGPRVALLTASAQLGAARDGASYVGDALDEVGHGVAPLGRVEPRAFAGAASDGRPLESLLYGAVVASRTARVDSLGERLVVGGRWLDMAVQTQVADAARQSASVGIAARPQVGWTRMVNPPCCQRCAVLAGKFYKWNRGFQRHPRCDCRHIPAPESDPDAVGVKIGAEDVKDLTVAQRQAVADGADLNQVINAHRKGARLSDWMYTTEGATRRGLAGKRLGAGRGKRAQRLTPDGIYRQAATREEAVALLKRHGYLI